MSRSVGMSCGRQVVRAGGRVTFIGRHVSSPTRTCDCLFCSKRLRAAIGVAGNSGHWSERPVSPKYGDERVVSVAVFGPPEPPIQMVTRNVPRERRSFASFAFSRAGWYGAARMTA